MAINLNNTIRALIFCELQDQHKLDFTRPRQTRPDQTIGGPDFWQWIKSVSFLAGIIIIIIIMSCHAISSMLIISGAESQ